MRTSVNSAILLLGLYLKEIKSVYLREMKSVYLRENTNSMFMVTQNRQDRESICLSAVKM